MTRRRNLIPLGVAMVAALVLGACGAESGTSAEDDRLEVVATFSVLHDIAEAVGGDAVNVHSIVPLGVDPHEHDPMGEDIEATTDADVLFWNGLNMEVGEGWFEQLVDTAGKDLDGDEVVEASEGVEPKYLTGDDVENGADSEINPHAFLDPRIGMTYTENIRDGLVAADPDHAETYEANAAEYLAELESIDEEYTERIAEIPEEDRVLVTSEHAFQYMTDRYGLEPGYLWAIDTEEQGTTDQINSLVEFVDERDVPALFVENNVDRRPMDTVADETGVDIAGTVYSDDLAEPGEDGATYLDALRSNIDQIHTGLTDTEAGD